MRCFSIAVALLCCLLFALPATATESPNDPAIAKLMSLSGTQAQVQQYPAVFLGIHAQQKDLMPPETYEIAKRLLEERFQAERLESRIFDELRQDFDPVSAQEVLEWLETPLGQRITRIEIENANSQNTIEAEKFGKSEECKETPEARRNLITRLIVAGDVIASNVAIFTSSPSKVLKGINNALPAEARMSSEFVDAILAEQRRKMRAAMERSLPVAYLFVYRSLTDADLEAYVIHLESEAGRWYLEQVSEALVVSVSEILDEVNLATMNALVERANTPKTTSH